MADNKIKRAVILLIFKIMTTRFARRIFRHPGNVVFVGSRICIKSSRFTTLAEAEGMRLISAHAAVPVPKIYLAFEHKDRVYIVMERIQGRNLAAGWVRRWTESKERIFSQLRPMIQELRNLQTPKSGGVSDVLGGPICDQRLPGQARWGPFGSIHDFHRKLRANIEIENIQEPGAVSKELKDLLRFHEEPWSKPVFTHGDLNSFNILVEGDKIVGIIDWETAGWMPPYWEYTSAWNTNPQNKFWQQEVDNFLEPQPKGLEMEAIRRKYFGDF